MSKWGDAVLERIAVLERKAAGDAKRTASRGDWHKEYTDLKRAVERSAKRLVTVRLGSIMAAEPITHRTTATFATYATGGLAVTIESLVPTFLDALVPPKNGYTFEYNAGTNKILAYTTADTEVGDSIDLSAKVGIVAVYVYGSRPTELPSYTSPGAETLVSAQFRCRDGVTADSTDYWTVELRVRRAGQTLGEIIEGFTTSAIGVANGAELSLLPPGEQVTIEAGDTVYLHATAQTAATSGFGEVFLDLGLQRKVL